MSNQDFDNGNSLKKHGDAGSEHPKVGDEARTAGYETERAKADTTSRVKNLAKDILDSRVEAGATILGQFATSVRVAADDLDRTSPTVSKVVRGFAQTVENCAEDLRRQTAEQLLRSASGLTRRQPALVFGIAALAGFVGIRTFKNATMRNSSSNGGMDPASSSDYGQPLYAQLRSGVTSQHDATSDETPDGLTAVEESLRQAAEDAPSRKEDDIPVFDRGTLPPTI